MNTTTYTLYVPLSRPKTVVQVADLHDRPFSAVVAALKADVPDIIAVTGDLFHRLETAKYALPFLREAAAIAPTFLSLGNHEYMEEGDARRLSETGAVLLDDAAVWQDDVYIGGLTSGFGRQRQGNCRRTPPPNLTFLDAFSAVDGFKLLLCHHPEYYPRYIRERDIDLTLSGHAHGGQWQIGGRGIFAPGQGLFPRYTGGVYEGRLVVSRGLVNTVSVPRFGNPTELVRIRLSPTA